MSLILLSLLSAPGLAGGTAVWLDGAPDPILTPELRALTAAQAAPSAPWDTSDARAIAALNETLSAVRPLKDELDGEPQILYRLDAALGPVEVIRPEDRESVYRALVFQGYAADRLFQDAIADDPAAEAYRTTLGDRPAVRAWVDAVAMAPDRTPTAEEIPDEPQRLAYLELRAAALLQKPASLELEGLPEGAAALVDGLLVDGDQVALAPGRHRVHVTVDGVIALRRVLEVRAGDRLSLTWRATAEELVALTALLETSTTVPLSASVRARLDTLEAPVVLIVSGRRAPLRYAIAGDHAVLQGDEPRAARAASALSAGVAVGGGWLYDGDFLLQNVDDGAVSAVGTVNAGTAVMGLSVAASRGPFEVAVGADLTRPSGAFHDLPVGDERLRLRAFPYLQVGHPRLGVAGGVLFPWHYGVGPRAGWPLTDHLGLVGSYTHGIPMAVSRAEGEPDFAPSAARSAWLGVEGQLSK